MLCAGGCAAAHPSPGHGGRRRHGKVEASGSWQHAVWRLMASDCASTSRGQTGGCCSCLLHPSSLVSSHLLSRCMAWSPQQQSMWPWTPAESTSLWLLILGYYKHKAWEAAYSQRPELLAAATSALSASGGLLNADRLHWAAYLWAQQLWWPQSSWSCASSWAAGPLRGLDPLCIAAQPQHLPAQLSLDYTNAVLYCHHCPAPGAGRCHI